MIVEKGVLGAILRSRSHDILTRNLLAAGGAAVALTGWPDAIDGSDVRTPTDTPDDGTPTDTPDDGTPTDVVAVSRRPLAAVRPGHVAPRRAIDGRADALAGHRVEGLRVGVIDTAVVCVVEDASASV